MREEFKKIIETFNDRFTIINVDQTINGISAVLEINEKLKSTQETYNYRSVRACRRGNLLYIFQGDLNDITFMLKMV
ncbi:hypothetical protein P5E48_08165 [Clostridium perfringens]|nr:hypothetical protein [Clostridium perfringens]MDK0793223.1 hypothetical protein [Clostridium perfringens]